MIQKDIKDYLNKLISAYPSIREIWLFGSKANPPHGENSDWDFFVFVNHEVLKKLRQEESFKRDDIELFIVLDGNHFESPWPLPRNNNQIGTGKLLPDSEFFENYNWKPASEAEATYLGRDWTGPTSWSSTEKRAYRIYSVGDGLCQTPIPQ